MDGTTMQPSKAGLTGKHWIQIMSTSIVFFNTWGLLLTFGVFQTYYEQVLLRSNSSSDIAWISTTCAFLLLASGIITGPLYDHGFYGPLLLFGSLLQVFGLMMMSLSTKYYQLFLSQAICVGIGSGMVFTPGVAAAAACLIDPATRARFLGLMACASSVGGVVFPLMFRNLVEDIGFPWTTRTIAFIVLVLYILSYITVLCPPEKPRSVRPLLDFSAFTEPPWLSISMACLLSATAYYIPFLYIPLLTELSIPGSNPNLSFDLLAITNGASGVGRILAGLAAAMIGPTETVMFAVVGSSIILFCWIAVDSVAGIVVWSVFWGIMSGAMIALTPAFVPLFSPSLAVMGTRSGMLWFCIGTGLFIGSPIGGAIFDLRSDSREYWRLQVFAGVLMLGAAAFFSHPLIHLRRRSSTL